MKRRPARRLQHRGSAVGWAGGNDAGGGMDCTSLGRTGLRVSIAGLGCGGFSQPGLGTGGADVGYILNGGRADVKQLRELRLS